MVEGRESLGLNGSCGRFGQVYELGLEAHWMILLTMEGSDVLLGVPI